MIVLAKLHLSYLLHRKTQLFLSFFVGFNMLMMIALSRFYDSLFDRIVEKEMYRFDYFMESFSLMKLSVLIVLIYVAIQICLLSPSDIVLRQRVKGWYLLISKLFVIVFVGLIFTLLLLLYQAVFGFLFHGGLSVLYQGELFIYMAVFVVFYSVLLMLLAISFDHIFPLFAVLIGYFSTEILIDFGVAIEQISYFGYLINIFFMNLHILGEEQLVLLVPLRIMVYVIVLYVSMTFARHQKLHLNN